MEQAFHLIHSFPDFVRRKKYPSMFKFQFHLITCLDDTCHVERGNLTSCFQFPLSLPISTR
eukprot:1068100-Ditylum_brightwellii.AAC.1